MLKTKLRVGARINCTSVQSIHKQYNISQNRKTDSKYSEWGCHLSKSKQIKKRKEKQHQVFLTFTVYHCMETVFNYFNFYSCEWWQHDFCLQNEFKKGSHTMYRKAIQRCNTCPVLVGQFLFPAGAKILQTGIERMRMLNCVYPWTFFSYSLD